MSTEIERKFMVASLPMERVVSRIDVRQGYLAEEGDAEVRVRITAERASITVKIGHGLDRTEIDAEVGDDDAEQLWAHTAGRRIEKVRHRVPVLGGVAEVDVYGGDLTGLVTAEVEFASRDDAEAFSPPAWFGREITGHDAWSNASLARHGRPRDDDDASYSV